MAHKFKIGQIVIYRPISHRLEGQRGKYQVIRLLSASQHDGLKYRIRNLNEQHELSAKESELKPLPNDKL